MEGNNHQKMIHPEDFVAPTTSVHRRGIECAWVDAKEWYKRARGNRVYLQSHLNEASWSKLRSPETDQKRLFLAFMEYLRSACSG